MATPTIEELDTCKHHFVGNLSIKDYYNVSMYENEVIAFLKSYYKNHDNAVMVGGSGFYIDAVCKGISELPDPDVKLREQLKVTFKKEGLEPLKVQLKKLDPEYYSVVDLRNPNRIIRALEVCLTTGQTFTSQRNTQPKVRDFNILKIGLRMPRKELFIRIENRVDEMITQGLVEEVKELKQFKSLNSLNTVGYKEIFNYLDGEWTLDLAVEKIKTNTRRYAKRQLTWFKKDEAIHWFHPDNLEEIVEFITATIQ